MERSILATEIHKPSDVAFAAQRSQLVASQLGVASAPAKTFGKAVRAAARNALAHAGSGKFRLRVSTRAAPPKLEAVVADSQPADRHAAAPPVTAPPAEEANARDMTPAVQGVDFFSLDSRPEGGAVVRLGMALPTPLTVDKNVFPHWAAPLARVRESAALGAALRQIAALCHERAAAVERQRDLEAERETLRASHQTLSLLATVARKTDSAVIVMDRQSQVEWVNAGFVRLTGYTPAEVTGFPPADFLHGPQTGPEAASEIAAAFAAARSHSQELLHYRKDGATYWASLSITPVFEEDGPLSRWICIFSDITSRCEAQAALERARDAAEAANRAKNAFLANMSHEARTPLNAVIAMTELALQTDLTPEQQEYLVAAKESAQSLLGRLNEILDLSKIEAGKVEVNRVEFNLTDLLDDTMKTLAVRAQQKDLELVWQPPQEMKEHLLGDPVRLKQILVSLVDNAIKFTDRGRVVVRVEPQWQTGAEVGLHCSVTDTGIGIPAGKLDRIFAGFTHGDSSTTRRSGGFGLGLALSSHLARLMRGEMWVESKESEGSTFHFTLVLGIPSRRGAQVPP